MQEKQIRIQKLLTKIVLLTPNTRQKLLSNIDTFSESKLDVILSFLEEAAKNQETLLWKSADSGTDILKEMKQTGRTLQREDLKNKEATDDIDKQKQLSDLENELEQIFNQ